MFLQEPTPDTSGYMIAGYAIAFLVMALYVFSMYLRTRNLNQDIAMLEEMDKPAAPAETTQPKPRPKKAAKVVTKRAG
ncbi:MAG TPA: hypothetical protein VN653_14270 [Anaerolineales bacterium]|nr:hypothetical protein [Anaerolineales bacterium]